MQIRPRFARRYVPVITEQDSIRSLSARESIYSILTCCAIMLAWLAILWRLMQ